MVAAWVGRILCNRERNDSHDRRLLQYSGCESCLDEGWAVDRKLYNFGGVYIGDRMR